MDDDAPALTATVSLTDLFQQKLAQLEHHEQAAKALRYEMQQLRESMTGVALKRPDRKKESAAAKRGRGARRRRKGLPADQPLPGVEPVAADVS